MFDDKAVYFTQKGIEITRTKEDLKAEDFIEEIAEQLKEKKGAIFASDYNYPERYSRWEIAFTDPCLEFRCYQRNFTIKSLNSRGDVLLEVISENIKELSDVIISEENAVSISGTVKESKKFFSEEERSKQSSIFLIIRKISEIFHSPEDDKLGLYGSFGYDLIFQFEQSIKHQKPRAVDQEDLVLFLPDRFTVVDNKLSSSYVLNYEFKTSIAPWEGLERIDRTPNEIKSTSTT